MLCLNVGVQQANSIPFVVKFRNTSNCNVAIHSKRPSPTTNILQPPGQIHGEGHTASKYQQYFDDRRKRFRAGAKPEMEWYHHIIAQCVGFACGTDFGFVALYTHNSMIAMQVGPTQFEDKHRDPRMTVRMSKVYRCDDENTSTLHAILALLRKGREHAESTTKHRLMDLKPQISCLSETQWESRSETTHESQCAKVPSESRTFGYVYLEETQEGREMVRRAMHERSCLSCGNPTWSGCSCLITVDRQRRGRMDLFFVLVLRRSMWS